MDTSGQHFMFDAIGDGYSMSIDTSRHHMIVDVSQCRLIDASENDMSVNLCSCECDITSEDEIHLSLTLKAEKNEIVDYIGNPEVILPNEMLFVDTVVDKPLPIVVTKPNFRKLQMQF